MWFLTKKQPRTAHQVTVPPPMLVIVENSSGNFYYHLMKANFRNKDGYREALCGAIHVMETSIPLDTWNYVGHLNESYCKECEHIATKLNVCLGK
jgi:hypothetical protein